MTEENLFGWRKLTDEEIMFLKTRRFYATALINKFLTMKVEVAALNLPNRSEAEKLSKKIRIIIHRAGLAPVLGCYYREGTIYIHTVREEGIKELPESIEAAISKKKKAEG